VLPRRRLVDFSTHSTFHPRQALNPSPTHYQAQAQLHSREPPSPPDGTLPLVLLLASQAPPSAHQHTPTTPHHGLLGQCTILFTAFSSHTQHFHAHMEIGLYRHRRGQGTARARVRYFTFGNMNEAELRQWVEANRGGVNNTDCFGRTPLHTAFLTLKSLPLVLWQLDEKGADVNAMRGFHRTSFKAKTVNVLAAWLDRWCSSDHARS
jgi:hypothetical protein